MSSDKKNSEPAVFNEHTGEVENSSEYNDELPPQKPQKRQSVLSKAISEHDEDATGPASELHPPSKGLTTQ